MVGPITLGVHAPRTCLVAGVGGKQRWERTSGEKDRCEGAGLGTAISGAVSPTLAVSSSISAITGAARGDRRGVPSAGLSRRTGVWGRL